MNALSPQNEILLNDDLQSNGFYSYLPAIRKEMKTLDRRLLWQRTIIETGSMKNNLKQG